MAARLTKNDLLKVFPTARSLAAACGVNESYVSKWKCDEPIPKWQELNLRAVVMPRLREKPEQNAHIKWDKWDKVANGKRAA